MSDDWDDWGGTSETKSSTATAPDDWDSWGKALDTPEPPRSLKKAGPELADAFASGTDMVQAAQSHLSQLKRPEADFLGEAMRKYPGLYDAPPEVRQAAREAHGSLEAGGLGKAPTEERSLRRAGSYAEQKVAQEQNAVARGMGLVPNMDEEAPYSKAEEAAAGSKLVNDWMTGGETRFAIKAQHEVSQQAQQVADLASQRIIRNTEMSNLRNAQNDQQQYQADRTAVERLRIDPTEQEVTTARDQFRKNFPEMNLSDADFNKHYAEMHKEQITATLLDKYTKEWLANPEEFAQKPGETLPIAGAVIKGLDLTAIKDSAKRIQDGEGTGNDYRTVSRFFAAGKVAQGEGFGGQVLGTLSEMPAFMLEFMLTGGAASMAKQGAKRFAEKMMGSMAERTVGKVAITALELGAGAAARTTILQNQVFQATARERVRSQLNGKDQSYLDALPVGLADTFIEMASEEMGEDVFGKLPSVGGAILEKIPVPRRMQALKNALTEMAAKHGAGDAQTLLEKFGLSGPLGESMEERASDVAKGALLPLLRGEEHTREDFGLIGQALTPGQGRAATKQFMAELASFVVPGLVHGGLGHIAEKLTAEQQTKLSEELMAKLDRAGHLMDLRDAMKRAAGPAVQAETEQALTAEGQPAPSPEQRGEEQPGRKMDAGGLDEGQANPNQDRDLFERRMKADRLAGHEIHPEDLAQEQEYARVDAEVAEAGLGDSKKTDQRPSAAATANMAKQAGLDNAQMQQFFEVWNQAQAEQGGKELSAEDWTRLAQLTLEEVKTGQPARNGQVAPQLDIGARAEGPVGGTRAVGGAWTPKVAEVHGPEIAAQFQAAAKEAAGQAEPVVVATNLDNGRVVELPQEAQNEPARADEHGRVSETAQGPVEVPRQEAGSQGQAPGPTGTGEAATGVPSTGPVAQEAREGGGNAERVGRNQAVARGANQPEAEANLDADKPPPAARQATISPPGGSEAVKVADRASEAKESHRATVAREFAERFGIEIEHRDMADADGRFEHNNPNKIVVASRLLDESTPEAIYFGVVVHEIHHALLKTDPVTWHRIADHISEADPKGLADAGRRYLTALRKSGHEAQVAKVEADPARLLNESVSMYLQHNIDNKKFVTTLARQERGVFTKVLDFLRDLIGGVDNPLAKKIMDVWEGVAKNPPRSLKRSAGAVEAVKKVVPTQSLKRNAVDAWFNDADKRDKLRAGIAERRPNLDRNDLKDLTQDVSLRLLENKPKFDEVNAKKEAAGEEKINVDQWVFGQLNDRIADMEKLKKNRAFGEGLGEQDVSQEAVHFGVGPIPIAPVALGRLMAKLPGLNLGQKVAGVLKAAIWGRLPTNTLDANRRRQGVMSYHAQMADNSLRDLHKAIKEAYGVDYRNADQKLVDVINAALGGQEAIQQQIRGQLQQFGPITRAQERQVRQQAEAQWQQDLDRFFPHKPMADAIRALRDHVDNLSDLLVGSGAVEGPLAIKFDLNRGIYLHRNYKVHDAADRPAWIEKLRDPLDQEGQRIMNQARTEFRQHGQELTQRLDAFSQMTDEQLNAEIDTYLKQMDTDDISGDMGGLDVLSERGEVPQWKRELYGEYTDAVVNYGKSVSKMARILANHQFSEFVKGLAGTGLVTDRPTPGKEMMKLADVELQSTVARGFKDSKLYIDTNFAKALQEIVGINKQVHPLLNFLGTVSRLAGLANAMKIVWNPSSGISNFVSGAVNFLGNGLDPRAAVTAFKTMWSDDATARKEYMRLAEAGLIDKGFSFEVMHEMAHDFVNSPLLQKAAGMVSDVELMRSVKEWAKKPGQWYRGSDRFWRLATYYGNKAMYSDKGLPAEEVEKRAIDAALNTYQNYEMTAPWVKQANLALQPFMGPTFMFGAESARNLWHTARIGWADMRTPGLQMVGARRLAAVAFVSVILPKLLTAASRWWRGVGDDEDEAARIQGMPWTADGDLLWTDPPKNGKGSFIDLSRWNYWSQLTRPLTAFLRGGSEKEFKEKMLAGVQAGIKPGVEGGIFWNAMVESASGKTARGRALEGTERLTNMGQTLVPGALSWADRVRQGIAGEPGRDMTTEALALFGRAAHVDSRVNLSYMTMEYKDKLNRAQQPLADIAKRGATAGVDAQNKAYEKTEAARREAFDTMRKQVVAAMTLGLTKKEIEDVLHTSRLSKDDTKNLLDGKYEPYEPPKGMADKAFEKASALGRDVDRKKLDEFERSLRRKK